MQRAYKCLSRQEFTNGNYRLIPIRDEDKYVIMQWRNEQIDILRQKEPLTKEAQERYFKNIVDKLFEQQQPDQLLFSFLENDILIGYGGLVHIDWESRNGEVSFITKSKRNENKKLFIMDFGIFLEIILSVAFDFLKFIKVHTTFYDIKERETYKEVITKFNFIPDAKSKNHALVSEKFEKVFIYARFNKS